MRYVELNRERERGNVCERERAVSYTHLDVYKRQRMERVVVLLENFVLDNSIDLTT